MLIAIAGRKGGSGKTTTSLNLGGALAEAGQSVLLVDLDHQASLSRLLLGARSVDCPGIGDRLLEPQKGISDLIQQALPGIALLPGDYSMQRAADAARDNPAVTLRLGKLLATVKDKYGSIILDTPPDVGFALTSALFAADIAIFPTLLTTLDFDALIDTIRLREELEELRAVAGLFAILPNAVPRNRAAEKGLLALRQQFPDRVAAPIPFAAAMMDAVNRALPVCQADPRSAVAAAYRALAQTVIKEECRGH